MDTIVNIEEAVNTPTIVKVKIPTIGIGDDVNGESEKDFFKYAKEELLLGKLSQEESNELKAIIELYEIAKLTKGEVEKKARFFENGNQYRTFWVKFNLGIDAEEFKKSYFASEEQRKYRIEIL